MSRSTAWLLVVCVVAAAVGTMGSSRLPDGLQWAAERMGLVGPGAEPGLGARAVLASLGAVLAFGLAWGLGRLLRRPEKE